MFLAATLIKWIMTAVYFQKGGNQKRLSHH